MVAGVKIKGGVASPFRVAVSGVDAASADFDQLIFDANQQPLRVWANGYFNASLIPYGTAGLAMPTFGLTTYACPAGQFPLFNVMFRPGDGGASDFLQTAKGIGGVINESDRGFYALSFLRQAGPSTVSTHYCNYLIFKNYG
jgi:hypothetical protein